MKLKLCIYLAVWLIVMLIGITAICSLLTMPSTFANIIAIIFAAICIWLNSKGFELLSKIFKNEK